MKRFLCLTLSVLLLIGCLAGCGSSDGVVTQTEEPAAAGTENVTFVFSQSEDIQSTNQFNDNSIVNISIFGLLFDYLIEQDHQGSFSPGLIEKWTQSEDGLTYSFRLKQDVCFSDGHPFTTAALKTSWEYAGGDETLAAYSKWSNVAEITCEDDYNMEVTLKEPDATFLVNVAQSAYVDPVEFEKLGAEAGSNYVFDQVLAVSDNGLKVGNPTVAGATVEASVVENGKARKVIVYKYKRKSGYHKKNGHRQQYTAVKIEKINA